MLPTLVEHYGEPFASSSAIPTYYVARETRQHVTVALNGDGGDECFAGYERYAAMRLAERYRRMPALLREQAIEPLVNLLPSSELRRGRVRDVKRFMRAASLPPVHRYLQWVSVMDVKTKSGCTRKTFAGSWAVTIRSDSRAVVCESQRQWNRRCTPVDGHDDLSAK